MFDEVWDILTKAFNAELKELPENSIDPVKAAPEPLPPCTMALMFKAWMLVTWICPSPRKMA